jgi:hypothetical protein
MNRLVETARTIESTRPETSHNKMLPFALAGDSFEREQAVHESVCFDLRKSKNNAKAHFPAQVRSH